MELIDCSAYGTGPVPHRDIDDTEDYLSMAPGDTSSMRSSNIYDTIPAANVVP